MTPERWQEVNRVWHAVLARPEHERARAVVEQCAGDEALRREVESLLASLGEASAAGFGVAPGIAVRRSSLIGHQLGPYTVRALLGVGGMGEVYRAHDSTLGREVALKLLPEPWLADPERRMRFEREARLLASLNHPNIAAIYGVQESAALPGASGPVRALVLELVEGETLADRLTAAGRGFPLHDVMDFATQMIEALEAAHARGVVHRDLKPANIKVTPEGRLKVLDFGLARAIAGDDVPGNVVSSPTLTAGGTHAGVLLGTAPYMSPEQARGRTADPRADIWAFGCVLFEMVTGAQAFGGQDVADVLASVLKAEPDWNAVPVATPPAVRLCLQRCLQKDLRQRFQDIGDVRLALAGAFDRPTAEPQPRNATTRLAWAGWAVALVAVAAATVLLVTRPGPVPESRLDIVTPPGVDPLSIDISPDGRSVVFQAGDRLWLRRLESSDAEPLSGTDFAARPFWSPDGRSIGFFANGELKRIDLADGFVRTLAAAPHPRLGTWNRNGIIVFGAVAMGPLYRVSAEGGAVAQATDLLPGQTSHRWPQFLPDGRRFLLMALGTPDVRGLYLGSLDDRTVRKVSDRESAFRFMPPVHLLVARDGSLLARRLSADYSSVEGEAVAVAPKVLVDFGQTGYASLRASPSGHIVYRTSAAQTQLVWLDRAGRLVGTIGEADDTQMSINRLSPDGRTAAVMRLVDGNTDVWLIDTERGIPRRLTLARGFDGDAVFSPDGRRIAYMSDDATDVYDVLYGRAADGTGTPETLFDFGVKHNHYPSDWSTDSRFILYTHESPDNQGDLWALPLTGARKPIEIARTPFFESDGRFSPEGRWVAYVSNETGRSQVFVRPFPGPAPNRQVSSVHGWMPRWRRDGGELFYIEEDRLVALPVIRIGTILELGPPRTLFRFPRGWGGIFEPSPDGQRFLITRTVTDASPITVIQNWKPPAR
jgi:serine/threonine protein kinase/Tol biopolymer transport system component